MEAVCWIARRHDLSARRVARKLLPSCRCFALPIALSLLCLGQTESSVPVLTLSDALSLAEKQNTQLQVSALDVQKAAEQTKEAKTQRFPVIKVYANAGESLQPIELTIPAATLGTYPATGPIPAHDSTITTPQRITGFIYGSAGQPLLQLYKINLAVKESRIGEQIAREQLRLQTEQTSQQVKQAYYQLTQLQSQISSADVSVKYLEELTAYTDRNLSQETALKSDSLTAKAKLSQQQYQLLTLRDSLDSQKEALNRLLGRDLRAEFTVQTEPPASQIEVSLSDAQNKALAQRPEMRQARLQTQKAELDVRRERAEYLPDLSAQLTYLSFPNVNFFPQNIVSVGLQLEWQPFDWGYKKHKLAELHSASKQATLTERDARQQILLDVNSSYRKLAEARALLTAQAALQASEREKLRVVMNRYQQKSALLTDFLQQQNSLASADTQYQQALSSFWTAKASFDRALGEQ